MLDLFSSVLSTRTHSSSPEFQSQKGLNMGPSALQAVAQQL